jgi:nitrogen-specific signal transduction histidine kinase
MMNYQELLQSPIIPPQIVPWIQKTAHNIAPVLIQGEQGTGKELIAKIIHHIGDWKHNRFYKIDCRILTEDAFNAQFLQLCKEINYGELPITLFLKEVVYLRKEIQLRLLQLVEDGILQNGKERKVFNKNIRFISSSSENLKERVSEGKFLEDLFYQLSTVSIFVPPLRDRSKEISLIAQYILKEYSKKMKIKKVEISNNVLTLLESYWWPGNLKELEHILIQSAIFSDGTNLIEKDLFFEIDHLKSSFPSFLKKAEIKTLAPMEKSFLAEQQTLSLSTFFIELVHRIKNPLVSIKSFTQLLREKFNDTEFRNHFYRVVTEDIENIDSLLNNLLDFVKINNPIEKKNTIHLVLEDVLKKHENQLKDKRIRIFKKYEQDLPETIIHEEQLRYIFSSLLQYAIASMPLNGSIGFLTKSLNTHKKIESNKILSKEDREFIEIIMIFTGYKKPNEQFKNVLGITFPQQEDVIEFELRLIKEIIQKNRGMMELEVNEKKPRTLISLKFPVERRKVIHYPLANN